MGGGTLGTLVMGAREGAVEAFVRTLLSDGHMYCSLNSLKGGLYGLYEDYYRGY